MRISKSKKAKGQRAKDGGTFIEYEETISYIDRIKQINSFWLTRHKGRLEQQGPGI